ncbi:hypothetical protein [uncultured Microbulbifer sp.]|uniref:hypothetical protein n=1 Tax=uncultured Microbulbifer sp. TaxID=348147 RepID=UPI002611B1F7|nr:hypothetical protein [uncultured Microbulbifer sp.]
MSKAMDKRLGIPPQSKSSLTSANDLTAKLECLIGAPFTLTGKSRTDGSNLRKLVGKVLLEGSHPDVATKGSYEIVPPKGTPKILLEYIDTYIVTTGSSYNLQVWNRNPASESVQVQYANGDNLQSGEVRFVLAKVCPENHVITAVAVLTPDYIVDRFGKFGKPTVKHQLIISASARQSVLDMPNGILFYDDDSNVGNISNINNLSEKSIHDEPRQDTLVPLSHIRSIVEEKLIGLEVKPAATKNRGQMLEEIFSSAMGYSISDQELLAGGYPDIRNQALEVKIQDSPTVDLGKYSPEFEDVVPDCGNFTTRTMRYLIALTNPETNIIEGAILCPGNKLGLHFTYVGDKSYKCQRSIPMDFFESFNGKSVFNP